MPVAKKKKTKKKKVATKKVATKINPRKVVRFTTENRETQAAAAIATILPKNLTKFLDNCGLKPSEAYFLGVASSQFISELTPLQRDLITNLLQLRTDTLDTP
jgi:hypothetical protein